jgi:hypothetical protein
MDLADTDQRRGWVSGDGFGQKLAVPGHRIPIVWGRKTQIQFSWRAVAAVSPAFSAFAGAETMPKPRRPVPMGHWQPMDPVGGQARRRRSLGQFPGKGALESHPARDASSLAAKAAHQARLPAQCIDPLHIGAGI